MNATTDTRNYYERELDEINFAGPHLAHVIFGSDGVTTKALAVNHESARAIIAKLTAIFMTGEPIPPPLPVPDPAVKRPYVTFKLGRDKNGNKVLKIKGEGKGFCIQTCGNLPQTHRDGISALTPAEVDAYTARYGTMRQRAILGL